MSSKDLAQHTVHCYICGQMYLEGFPTDLEECTQCGVKVCGNCRTVKQDGSIVCKPCAEE